MSGGWVAGQSGGGTHHPLRSALYGDDRGARRGDRHFRSGVLPQSMRGRVTCMASQVGAGRSNDAAMAEQVDLDADRKKEILSLERALDQLNHFEVLGLRPGASNAEVKKAYHEASRRYH